MRDEKEERSKQGQINNKAKQHSTPKAVTSPCTVYIYYPLTTNRAKDQIRGSMSIDGIEVGSGSSRYLGTAGETHYTQNDLQTVRLVDTREMCMCMQRRDCNEAGP